MLLLFSQRAYTVLDSDAQLDLKSGSLQCGLDKGTPDTIDKDPNLDPIIHLLQHNKSLAR